MSDEQHEAQTVYLVQRENFDGLYAFEDEEDRDAYAELFPEADWGAFTVLGRRAAARLIQEERRQQEDEDG